MALGDGSRLPSSTSGTLEIWVLPPDTLRFHPQLLPPAPHAPPKPSLGFCNSLTGFPQAELPLTCCSPQGLRVCQSSSAAQTFPSHLSSTTRLLSPILSVSLQSRISLYLSSILLPLSPLEHSVPRKHSPAAPGLASGAGDACRLSAPYQKYLGPQLFQILEFLLRVWI